MNRPIYEKNMKTIKSRYPHMLEALKSGAADLETIQIGLAEIENRHVLYAIKDEKQFQMDSIYNSDYLMEEWIGTLDTISYQGRFVWFGFGNGMYVRKLLSVIEKTVEIIIFEPSLSVIAAVIEEIPINDLLEDTRVHLVVADYGEDKLEELLFQHLNYANKACLHYGSYLNYGVLFPTEQEVFYATLQIILNSINSTQSVQERFGEAYFRNTFANLPYLVEGCTLEQLYYILPKDVPAIIAAAGPSLDKNIQELKKAKGRAFIIAVDTAVRALLREDVVPDIFVTVDGKKMAAHFTDERLRKIPVICCLHGNKDALLVHTGKKFFFDDENPYIMDFFKMKNREFAGLSTGGSVANDAFSFLDMMRFKTIILVGQDLAYTDNKTHAGGTVAGELGRYGQEERVELEGYYGGKVLSSHEYELYLHWFENEIQSKPDLHVINSTEGGANISGALNMSLADALKETCHREVDFGKLIDQIPPFFNEEEQREFRIYNTSIVTKLEDIMYKAGIGIRNYGKMEELIGRNLYKGRDMTKLCEKTGEISREIDNSPVMCFVEYRVQEETKELLSRVYDKAEDEKQELIQTISQGKEYMTLIQKTIKKMLPVIRDWLSEEDQEKWRTHNQMMAQIQGLIGQMQLNLQIESRYWDE